MNNITPIRKISVYHLNFDTIILYKHRRQFMLALNINNSTVEKFYKRLVT